MARRQKFGRASDALYSEDQPKTSRQDTRTPIGGRASVQGVPAVRSDAAMTRLGFLASEISPDGERAGVFFRQSADRSWRTRAYPLSHLAHCGCIKRATRLCGICVVTSGGFSFDTWLIPDGESGFF